MKNEKIAVLRGPDRVRQRPAVIFSSDGIEGVACAVRSLLEIFVVEAQLGWCQHLCVRQNGAELTISGDDRGIELGADTGNDAVWKKLFCEISAAPAYAPNDSAFSFGLQDPAHDALYADEKEQTAGCLPDEIGLWELCAIQCVSEWMEVQAKRNGRKTTLRFEKGYPIGAACTVKTEEDSGTRFRFRPDRTVFTETTLPENFFRETLNAFAALSPGLQCRYINDELGTEEVFSYPSGLQDYVEAAEAPVPAYVRKIRAEGKERYNRAQYEACVEVAISYAPCQGSIKCFHNFRELHWGGSHCQILKEQLCRAFNDAFRRHMADAEELTFEQLAPHLRMVLATWCTPRCTVWGSGARESIENRLIADMTYDAAGSELCRYVFAHRETFREVLDMLHDGKN